MAYSRPLSFPSTQFFAIPPPPIGAKGTLPIPFSKFDSSALFTDPSATPSRSLGPCFSGVQVLETVLILFKEIWMIDSIVSLALDR